MNGPYQEIKTMMAYGNTFCIPLGEMFELTRDLPLHQPGLHDRLQMIKDGGTAASGSTPTTAADHTYKITNIAVEIEIDKVNHEGLACAITV